MNTSIPKEFIDRLQSILPPEHYQKCFESFHSPKMTAFRVNTLKATADTVIDQLSQLSIPIKPLREIANVYLVELKHRRKLTDSEPYKLGMIYIQNPSSILAVQVLDPQPGEEILDLAAAPGGKTLYMADLMKNQGRIGAVDAVKSRFFKLKNNIKTYGADIVDCYLKDGSIVGRQVPDRFDRVLLDAPCSSESRFHIDKPKSYQYWSEKKIKQMAKKQKNLLASAVAALKSGGTLVYCTCSFAPEENEAVIQWLLDRNSDIEILPFTLPIKNSQPGLTHWNNKESSPSLKLAQRLLPTTIWNGLFICVLTKSCIEG